MTKAEYIAKHRATIEEASRRMSELRHASEYTPALKILQGWTKRASKVRFNKKMTKADLARSLAEAKRFVGAKSSTVEGMRQIRLDRETRLGDLLKQYGQEGLTTNTTGLFRVLGSVQFSRAKSSNIDSNILVAYVNRQIASGKTAAGIKGQLSRIVREINEKNIEDPQAVNTYIRERWGI